MCWGGHMFCASTSTPLASQCCTPTNCAFLGSKLCYVLLPDWLPKVGPMSVFCSESAMPPSCPYNWTPTFLLGTGIWDPQHLCLFLFQSHGHNGNIWHLGRIAHSLISVHWKCSSRGYMTDGWKRGSCGQRMNAFKLSLPHSPELFYDWDFNLAHINGEEGWDLDEVGE